VVKYQTILGRKFSLGLLLLHNCGTDQRYGVSFCCYGPDTSLSETATEEVPQAISKVEEMNQRLPSSRTATLQRHPAPVRGENAEMKQQIE
jgi:hypothetical protein